jgi:hypothetical protein
LHDRFDRPSCVRVGREDECVEIRERKPAPRRAQHCEPREPIGRLRDRMGQRDDVAHCGAVAEHVEVDRRVGNGRGTQRRKQRAEVPARAHQDRDVAARCERLRTRRRRARFLVVSNGDVRRTRALPPRVRPPPPRQTRRALPRIVVAPSGRERR